MSRVTGMKRVRRTGFMAAILASSVVLACGCSGEDGTDGAAGTLVSLGDAGTNCPNGGTSIRIGVDADGDGVLADTEVASTEYVCDGEDPTLPDPPDDGRSIAVSAEPETAGANCAAGGTRISHGVDDNGNGTLDTAEVDGESFICDGEDGGDALSSLLAVAVEAAGANCADGGHAVSHGLDDDADGTLDAGEVDTVSYVCNGDAGSDALPVLFSVRVEPVGTNCPAGGHALSQGVDTNGNAALDTAEITAVTYVCDGEAATDPLPVLLANSVESPGVNCPEGGQSLSHGVDDNGNGALDPAEVDATFYVCDGHSSVPVRLLDTRVAYTTDAPWLDVNRAAINQLLLDHGVASPSFDPAHRPVAVFDWDNTVIKNDIGDATTAWMVRHSKFRQPVGKDWGTSSPYLTAAAKADLNTACDGIANELEPLPTGDVSGQACAAEVFSVYYNGRTVDTDAAWTSSATLTNKHAYAWVSQLMTGYTPYEINGFAEAAFLEALNAPIGSTRIVGGISMPAFIRIYDEIRDLIGALEANGFDVWVLTASPQYVVEAIVPHVGLTRDRVIGIRSMLDANGLIKPTFQGCGSHPDDNTTLITYYDGKRCWINKVIYSEPTASQEATNPDPTKRPVFVAGDSETDMSMLKDATALRLVIDRQKSEPLCHALYNLSGLYFVQQMFIRPKSTSGVSYACSTTTDPGGTVIVDENGAAIPDQTY